MEDSNELFIIEAGKYINSLPDSVIRVIKDNNAKVNTRPVADLIGVRYEE